MGIGKVVGKLFGMDNIIEKGLEFIDEMNLTEEEKAKQKEKFQERFSNQLMVSDANQAEINKEEAKKGGIQGLWRPLLGVIGAVSLGVCFASGFVFTAIVSGLMIYDPESVEIYKQSGEFFKTNTDWILTHTEKLVYGLLGLAGYRTVEKLFGKA